MTERSEFICEQCGEDSPAINLIPVAWFTLNGFAGRPFGEQEGHLCDDCAIDIGYRITKKETIVNGYSYDNDKRELVEVK